MPDFGSSDLANFRDEARTWIRDNLPPSLANNEEAFTDNESARTAAREDMETWRNRLAEKGWGAPTWPQQPHELLEHGQRLADMLEGFVENDEINAAGLHQGIQVIVVEIGHRRVDTHR